MNRETRLNFRVLRFGFDLKYIFEQKFRSDRFYDQDFHFVKMTAVNYFKLFLYTRLREPLHQLNNAHLFRYSILHLRSLDIRKRHFLTNRADQRNIYFQPNLHCPFPYIDKRNNFLFDFQFGIWKLLRIYRYYSWMFHNYFHNLLTKTYCLTRKTKNTRLVRAKKFTFCQILKIFIACFHMRYFSRKI